jgi:hypothetical protein
MLLQSVAWLLAPLAIPDGLDSFGERVGTLVPMRIQPLGVGEGAKIPND